MKKRTYSVWVILLSMMMLFSVLPVSAAEIQAEVDWESKVSEELLEVMATKTDTDLITVYIWLNDIDHDIIDRAMIKEKGMDPAVYENEERFNEEIVPQIEAQIVSRVGYEVAHATAETSEYILDQNGAYHDDTMSLVDRAIQAKENEYIMSQRQISRREHSEHTNTFVEKNVDKNRKLISVGEYIPRIIVEATKAEIKYYAGLSDVEEISLYIDYIPTSGMDTQINQVEAGYSGTKGSDFNGGDGFKGTGIKIGIMEAAGGRYDVNCPHLSSIPSSRLVLVNEAGVDGAAITSSVSDHATIVTSIVVGQAVSVGSNTYEGVVPLATVYQMPTVTVADAVRGFEKLVDYGVTVINYSASLDTEAGYHSFDKDIDALIYETGITFVAIAGNSSGNVESPGKAFNAITVGNVKTVSSSYETYSSPYAMNSSSSFSEADFLPNKPDVSAPGSYMRVVKTTSGTSNFYLNKSKQLPSGTSYAAPIVTGIVAQIQQAGALGFSMWPALVKSVLVTGADPSAIRTDTSTPSDATNTHTAIRDYEMTYLWEKSGAGLVNAVRSVTIANTIARWNLSYFSDEGDVANTSGKYFTAGQRLRVCVTFEKMTDDMITSYLDFDDIDLTLIDPDGIPIAYSSSSHDNVVVIDHTVTKTGYYSFQIECYTYVHDENERLMYYYSWYAY